MSTLAPLGALAARVPPVLPPRTLAVVRAAVLALALLPLLRLLALGASDALGANPVEFVLRDLGTWTLVMLLATLGITPLRWLTGWAWPLRLRRMLGLTTFFYASLHLLAYAGLDQGFDLGALWHDVFERPYITAGAAAYLMLVPLAVTSSNGWVRRLGGRRWQALHRLVYAIGLAAILHYWWHKAGKNDFGAVSAYAVVLGVLLGARLARWLQRR